ncbi:MAG: DUF481 domain-containing protein [Cyclobacteriaceae bacterium]
MRIVLALAVFCGFGLCLAQAQNNADSVTATNQAKYSGWVNLGFSGSRGNVERKWNNYAFDISRKTTKNVITFDAQYRDFFSRGNKVDENIDGSLIDVRKISGDSWLYTKISYHRNTYRGFDHQWKFGGGYLHQFFDKEHFTLASRLGYQVRLSEVSGNLDGDYNQGVHHFALIGFKTQFGVAENVTFKTKFDLELDVERGENYSVLSKSDLVFKINKWLAFQMSYFYHYAGLPVTGRLALDERLDGSLKITF